MIPQSAIVAVALTTFYSLARHSEVLAEILAARLIGAGFVMGGELADGDDAALLRSGCGGLWRLPSAHAPMTHAPSRW